SRRKPGRSAPCRTSCSTIMALRHSRPRTSTSSAERPTTCDPRVLLTRGPHVFSFPEHWTSGRGARWGEAMNRLLFLVDEISTWVGKTAGWCIVILTFTTSYEVFMRYLFLAPTEWAFDAAYMLYGTLFMFAGAYTLSRNAHVRGDFIYRAWSPRTQAKS